MYTWEIKNYLNKKRCNLNEAETKYILDRNVNPQICSVEWQDYNNGFYVTTKEEKDGIEYNDGFFFKINDYNIENGYLNSGVKKYLIERDYKLVSEEIRYLILGHYPNTKVSFCKWEIDKYFLKLEITDNRKVKYFESYIFEVYTYDYKRENGQIVLRDESSKEENIVKKR